MKYILFILLLFVFINSAYSEYGWYKLSCEAYSNFTSITFTDKQNGWVSTYFDIFKTTDGGNSWLQEQKNFSAIQNVSFFDHSLGFALSNGGTDGRNIRIQKTTNSGNYWYELIDNSDTSRFSFNNLFLRNDKQICLSGTYYYNGASVATSYDGGKSWAFAIITNSGRATGSYYTDNINGWIVTEYGSVFKTSNYGVFWDKVLSDDNNNNTGYFSIFFLNKNLGWIGGNNGILLYTIDGGHDWYVYEFDRSIKINDIFYSDSSNGWLATNKGIYYTSDGGQNWTQQVIQSEDLNIKKFCFIDNKNAWAIGDTFILHTYRGGKEPVNINPKILYNGDLNICYGDSLLLTASPQVNDYSYKWSTGETSKSIYAKKSGKYILTVSSQDFVVESDTVELFVNPELTITINGELSMCNGTPTTLSIIEDYPSYIWSNGSKTKSTSINLPGTYSVKVSNNTGCSNTLNFNIIDKGISNIINTQKIEFDSTEINESKENSIKFINLTNYYYKVKSVKIKNNPDVFSITPVGTSIPFNMSRGDSCVLKISFTPNESKLYKDSLIIISDIPCDYSEKIISINGVGYSTTSVNKENTNNNKLYIYPNPVSSILYIKGIDSDSDHLFKILTLSGIEVLKSNETNIDVSKLSTGVYILKINSDSYKFIKM